jgi:hypothetical protein
MQAPLVWGVGCQELKHGTNLLFFFLSARTVVEGKPSADADRPRESGGGGRWLALGT